MAARLAAAGRRVEAVAADSLEELAQAVEAGSAVLFVNAGLLWGDPHAADAGEANHCVVVRPGGRGPAGAVIVVDPARPAPAAVPDAVLLAAWLGTGGRMLAVG